MQRKPYSGMIGRIAGLISALGAAGLRAQEVVDLPAEDVALPADLELVYRIGSAVAVTPWEEFSTIQGVGFDNAGNLYLLDGAGAGGGRRVVVVDASGRHVRTMGRPGQGPGEFRRATQLVVWADGHVLVEDRRAGYHLFGPGGEFERTVRETGGGAGFAVARRPVSRPNLRPERTSALTLLGRSRRTIQRVHMSSEEVRVRVLVEAWAPVEREAPGSGGIEDTWAREEWGFEPDLLFDGLPSGGVAFSDSSAWSIKLTDPSGAVRRILRRPIRPLAVTAKMEREELESRLEAEGNRTITGSAPPPEIVQWFVDGVRLRQREAIENMRFFPEVPVIATVRTTWSGALWLQRSTEPGSDEPSPIDVIAPDGRYVGTLETGITALPDMPDAFGPDGLVAFIETDEFDVPVITVRRIPRHIR